MTAYTLTFLMCLAIDWVYVLWFRYAAARKPVQAALYTVAYVLLGQASTILCVHDWWLVLPACAGHAVGTIIAVTCGDFNELRSR